MNVFIDPRFDRVYGRYPLVLADIGARGGLKAACPCTWRATGA
jgi:hypothetical protein